MEKVQTLLSRRVHVVFLCIFTSGFSAFGLETIYFLKWSLYQGQIYVFLPLLLSSVFLGLSVGSLLVYSSSCPERCFFRFLFFDSLCLSFIVVAFVCDQYVSSDILASFSKLIIVFLFIYHVLTGIQFRLACYLVLAGSSFTRDSGKLYGIDALGGASAAILTGFTLPILGIITSFTILLYLKVTSFLFIVIIYILELKSGFEYEVETFSHEEKVKYTHFFIPGFLLGAGSVITQSGVIRFCLQSAGESHLSFGIPPGLWLLGVCSGSIIFSTYWKHRKNRCSGKNSDPLLEKIFYISVFFQYPVAVTVFLITGCEYTSAYYQLLLISLFIIFPVAFISGAIFPFLSSTTKNIISVPAIFGWEGLGSLAGGFIFYYFLNFWGDWTLPWCIGMLWFTLLSVLKKKPLFVYIPIVLIFILLSIFHTRIDFAAAKYIRGTRDESLLFLSNSVSGKVEIIQKENNKILMVNHLAMYSTSTDKIHNTSLVFIPAMYIPSPKRILIIGGCTGGAVREALILDPAELVYCEIDPVFSKVVNSFFPEHLRISNTQTTIEIIIKDGWQLLGSKPEYYDMIILDLPTPVNLQLARFFTLEGFERMKRTLRDGGILSLILPGSYVHPSELNVNASIVKTLRKVFQNTKLFIPYREKTVQEASSYEKQDSSIFIPYMEIFLARKNHSFPEHLNNRHPVSTYLSKKYFSSMSILGEKYYNRIYSKNILKQINIVTTDRLLLPALKWTQQKILTRPVLILPDGTPENRAPMFKDFSETW